MRLTAWVRIDNEARDLGKQLISAIRESPAESAEMEGLRDLHWTAATPNDALTMAERIKSFCDDPDLVLLKVTTQYPGGAVDAVTFKDERGTLTG
jgi:hypothetical protein